LATRYPSHSPIHNHFLPSHEAALVTREENYHVRLFDCFAETSRGEVDFTAGTLGVVVSEEITKDFSRHSD
jgi:hypothetical protein